MRDLEKLVAGFTRDAKPGAQRSVNDYLPAMLRERLRQERDDAERRRLLLQFSANLLHPARAPTDIDDARNLLARPASQEAVLAAIKAASEQQRPTPLPTPGPRPGSDMTL